MQRFIKRLRGRRCYCAQGRLCDECEKLAKKLKEIRKNEEKIARERARKEREAEILRLLEQRERAREVELEKERKKKEEEDLALYKKQAEAIRRVEEEKKSTMVKKQKKPKMVKKQKQIKTTKAGPRHYTRYLDQPRLPGDVRFVNCFYRFCCQFYCWMTILVLVGLGLFLYL